MKQLIIALSFAVAAGATFARAAHAPATAGSGAASTAVADAAQPGTPQRSKMKTCNADARAKDLHGPDRKSFMKQCLSGKARPVAAS